MLTMTIDGKKAAVPEGSTILTAARSLGIEIPTLCWLEGLDAYGGCRICMVEVEGARNGVAPACATPVVEGMVVRTDSESARSLRKSVLEMILATHHADCFNCRKMGACDLHRYSVEYGLPKIETGLEVKGRHPDTSHPFFDYDKNKCVLCGRCVRVCSELQVSRVLEFAGRGQSARVAAAFDDPMAASSCVSCGNCVSNCPVGALVPKRKSWLGALYVDRRVRTVCGYCGVGCSLELLVRGKRVVGVEPANGPANEGLLCVKGKFAYEYIGHPDRLTSPLIRKGTELVPATWDEALALVAERARETVERHGADALAGLSSARCTNEENYLFQKLFRAAIGTNNVDHCARLCHASTVAGLAKTLGSGAMTGTIRDIDNAEAIFVTGSNTTETHPVIGSRIRRAVARGARLVVADPRRIELADEAELYLRIAPGSNVALYNAMASVLLSENLGDKAFVEARTEGFAELAAALAAWTPERAAPICGVPAQDIRKAARIYGGAKSATILYAMGVTQHESGTDGVVALSNLALLAGKIGKPGSNLDPLRGQNNVQGACDMGALPDTLPGYRKVTDPAARAAVAAVWGVEPPSRPGLAATQMMEHVARGLYDEGLRFLYVMGENLALSDPDLARTREALAAVDFLVVQDLFLTETASLADVVLPAACFAEKEGSFTNTERRVQRVRKALAPPGEARADLEILVELLRRLGLPQAAQSPAEVLAEAASIAPIYAGIGLDRLGDAGIQWPCPDAGHPGTPILHTQAFARGRARLIPVEWRPILEPVDLEYPILLTTGRLLYQYHTRTMTGRSPGLDRIAGTSFVELAPETAAALGVVHGSVVRITSRRGSIEIEARVSDRLESGIAFMPFHFAKGAANVLTSGDGLDPEAKIPELKATAVKIELVNATMPR